MKTSFFAAILLALLFVLPTACEKWSGNAEGEVEFYLLESYETEDQSFAIINSTVKLEKKAMITYSEIKSYNDRKHIFTITDAAADLVKDLYHSVHGLAFAVTANGELVYTGYFWPSYSSMGCQWIVIDPLMLSGENELRVQLGYPGQIDGVHIPDERNNSLILDIFRRDGKLK